jgi:hypothetical protein
MTRFFSRAQMDDVKKEVKASEDSYVHTHTHTHSPVVCFDS